MGTEYLQWCVGDSNETPLAQAVKKSWSETAKTSLGEDQARISFLLPRFTFLTHVFTRLVYADVLGPVLVLRAEGVL